MSNNTDNSYKIKPPNFRNVDSDEEYQCSNCEYCKNSYGRLLCELYDIVVGETVCDFYVEDSE